MFKARRWNDWFLLGAIVCFVISPVGSFFVLIVIEQPEYRRLQESALPHGGSGQGHFLSAAVITLARRALTVAGLMLGLILAFIGSFRIPASAASSRKLRDVTWNVFVLAFAAGLGLLAMS